MRRTGSWSPSATSGSAAGGRSRSAAGSEPTREANVFQVVDHPRQLVYTSTTRTPDGSSINTGMQVTFEEENGKTRVTIVQSGFPTAERQDEFAGGWASILDELGRVVTARVERSR